MSNTLTNAKHKIAANFSKNSSSYDQHARVQKYAADKLCGFLSDLKLKPGSKILEIGCGTGFITKHLVEMFPDCTLIITDISPDMLAKCRDNLLSGEANLDNVYFQVLDGESIESFERYDVVVSGLTGQWFEDLPAWLDRAFTTMRPESAMFVSYLSDKSFPEWKDSCSQINMPYTGNSLPPDDLLCKKSKNKNIRCLWETEFKTENYDSLLHFFAELKFIGATTRPTVDKESMTPVMLRKLNEFHSNGRSCEISHHIVYGIITA